MPVSLDALEDLLAVVEYGGRRGQAEVAIRDNAIVTPPLSLSPASVGHMVGEVVTEVEVSQDHRTLILSDGRRVGGQREATGDRIGLRHGNLCGTRQGCGCEVVRGGICLGHGPTLPPRPLFGHILPIF